MKKQFCKRGHDTFICGREKGGSCCICVQDYRKARKNEFLEYGRQWRVDNASKLEEYYDANREKRRKSTHEWHLLNKDKVLKRNKVIKVRFLNAKSQAKYRKIYFDLTLEQYIDFINKGCYYCGESLLESTAIGLDRINNDKSIGYRIDNLLPCCGLCNQTRGDRWTVEETKIMILAILESRKNRALVK